MEFDNKNELNLTSMLKGKIKNIPIIGFFLRFLNTFIHLNNLKFKLYADANRITNLECIVQDQEKITTLENLLEIAHRNIVQDQEKITTLENSLEIAHRNIELISKDLEQAKSIVTSMDQSIASHIYYQLHSVQHRLDLLESKTDSSNNTAK